MATVINVAARMDSVQGAHTTVLVTHTNSGNTWYLMAKDEGHGFAKKKNVDFQFYSTILFFQENLLR